MKIIAQLLQSFHMLIDFRLVGIWLTVSCQEQLTLSNMPDYLHPGLKGLVIGWAQYQLHQSVWKWTIRQSELQLASDWVSIWFTHTNAVVVPWWHRMATMASHARKVPVDNHVSQINGIIHRAFLSADVLATREPTGLCTECWGDWKTSRRSNNRALEERTAWDNLSGHFCYFTHSSFKYLVLPQKLQRKRKLLNTADLPAGIDFVPIAISGAWGEKGFELNLAEGLPLQIWLPISERISLAERGNAFLRQVWSNIVE